jgi:hypothetical protein
MKGGENMTALYKNAIVEFVNQPKLFKGQAIVSTVGEKFVWCDWHYGFGMVNKKDLKVADDQSKVIYKR